MNTDKKIQPNSNEIDRLVLGMPLIEEQSENLLEEIEKTALSPNSIKRTEINDFQALKEEDVFSSKACYKLLNRTTQRVFYINGCNLESKIGLDTTLYNKIKSRKDHAFIIGNQVVAFHKFIK